MNFVIWAWKILLELALVGDFSPCKVIWKAFQNDGLKYYLQIEANMSDAGSLRSNKGIPLDSKLLSFPGNLEQKISIKSEWNIIIFFKILFLQIKQAI